MQLLDGIIADGAALYLEHAHVLILSDLHIGYEEERRKGGVLLPQEQKKYFKKEIDRLFKSCSPIAHVVLAGDIKHEFGTISKEEWNDVQELIGNLREREVNVIALGGNHDNLIKPILEKLGMDLNRSLIFKNGKETILITHGDTTIEELVETKQFQPDMLNHFDTVIIGHEHPAMRITDGLRTETAKCFLVGKQKLGKRNVNLIVMPSWNPLAFGTDVLSERPLGPLLKQFIGFSAFAVIESQVLAFGLVEDVRKL